MAVAEQLVHPLVPLYDESSRVLILGSFPSPLSREWGFYYGNPQNRMWRMLAALWGEELPRESDAAAQEAKRAFCSRHHLALWDVIASCTITGAADASITDVVPNDIRPILTAAPISLIVCGGTTAYRLYRRYIEPVCARPALKLPSTSPANAAWSLERLVEAWAPVRAAADGKAS